MRYAMILLAVASLTGFAGAQSAATISYTGCVSQVPQVKAYVLASAGRCLLLQGDAAGPNLVLHEVVLSGELLPATGLAPDTLSIRKVMSVRGACSTTCTLPVPGTRGVHGNEHPGNEGGTPGLIKPPQP